MNTSRLSKESVRLFGWVDGLKDWNQGNTNVTNCWTRGKRPWHIIVKIITNNIKDLFRLLKETKRPSGKRRKTVFAPSSEKTDTFSRRTLEHSSQKSHLRCREFWYSTSESREVHMLETVSCTKDELR